MSEYSCMQCRLCANERRKGAIFPYNYKGIIMQIESSDRECDSCAIKRYRGVFERIDAGMRLGIIKNQAGNLSVNWILFVDTMKNPQGYEQNFYYRLVDLLIDLGIFTFALESGSVLIMRDDSGQIDNPDDRRKKISTPIYFTRLEDAREYAKQCLLNASYRWSLARIGEIIKKEEAVK